MSAEIFTWLECSKLVALKRENERLLIAFIFVQVVSTGLNVESELCGVSNAKDAFLSVSSVREHQHVWLI